MDERERIFSYLRWREEATSTRVARVTFGTALFNDHFPKYWDGNFVRIERSVESTFDALLEEVDRLYGSFEHREVVFVDEAEGSRWAPTFATAGWEVDALLLMSVRRVADREASLDVEERSFEEMYGLLVEGNLESADAMTHEEAVMNAAIRRVFTERTGARFFLALVDGAPAGFCELYAHDDVAEIDDVHTLKRFRGRGAATAVVTRAVREAQEVGADLVFLIADDADWPKDLYAKLGFEPVARFWQFRKTPPGHRRRVAEIPGRD